MNPAEGFVEFVRIVDAGSVSEAARQLGVPRPTLSRRLANLEDTLGVRLLHRRTRSMTLTRAGETLLPRARRVVESALDARDAVARVDDVPRGRLRVTVPPDLRLGACFVTFAEQWPEVQLEVLATTRRVSLVTEGIDIALRAGPPGDEALVSRTLLRMDTCCVAAPSLLDTLGMPSAPGDLATAPCLVQLDVTGRPATSWPLRAGGRVPITPAMAANDLHLLQEFATAFLDHLTDWVNARPALLP